MPHQQAFNAQQQYQMMQAAQQRMAQQQQSYTPPMQQHMPPMMQPPHPPLPYMSHQQYMPSQQQFIPPHMMQMPPNMLPPTNSNIQQFDQFIQQISAELHTRPELKPLIDQIRYSLLQPDSTLAAAIQAVTNALQSKPSHTTQPNNVSNNNNSATQPPYAVPPPIPPTPPKTFANSELFKQRDDYVIWQLYFQHAIQCSICGIRTQTNDEMTIHLDYHFKINKLNILRQGKQRNQNWFLARDEWIIHRDIIFDTSKSVDDSTNIQQQYDTTHNSNIYNDNTIHRVIVDENQKLCSICHDKFMQVFDDSTEQWMYDNAILVDENTMLDIYNDNELTQHELIKKNKRISVNQQYNGQILHYNCYDALCMVSTQNNHDTTADQVPELEHVEVDDAE